MYMVQNLPVYVPCHSEISDFDHPPGALGRQQAVPGGDVPVNEPVLFHIFATFCNVCDTAQQILHR